jgi:hypothetical protein
VSCALSDVLGVTAQGGALHIHHYPLVQAVRALRQRSLAFGRVADAPGRHARWRLARACAADSLTRVPLAGKTAGGQLLFLRRGDAAAATAHCAVWIRRCRPRLGGARAQRPRPAPSAGGGVRQSRGWHGPRAGGVSDAGALLRGHQPLLKACRC